MANVLHRDKQLMILRLLVEGNSLRAVTRITGVHRTTVMNLMVTVGEKCDQFMADNLRNVKTSHVELDEQWTWVGKKQARTTQEEHESGEVGDQYLFLGLEQDSRLIIAQSGKGGHC